MENSSTPYTNSVFEQPWFLDVVAGNEWQEIKVEEKGDVMGRWAVPFDGKKISMPPQTQTLGIWLKPGLKLSKQKKIIGELVARLPKTRSISIMLDPSNEYFLPYRWLGFNVYPRVTYRFNDLSDIDEIEKKYDKTVKKNIRSAQNKGVKIIEDENVDNLYSMLEATFKLQNRKYPYSKELISNIFQAAKKHGSGIVLTAVDSEGSVHASSMFLYDERTCYYLISGADPELRSSGAQTLLIHESIKFASTVSRAFDFEGSMIEGIETFFRRFGCEPAVYYEISKKSFLGEVKDLLKPRIKRLIGYKM